MNLDKFKVTTLWQIAKYNSEESLASKCPDSVEVVDGNLGLNEGITELLKLLIGGTATAFNAANAYIGVGDSTTEAAATQTGLQGSNKTFKGMDEGYPQVSGTSAVFKATFEAAEANHNWKEFSILNGNSDTAKNLNRKVTDLGTKTAGATWELTATVTIS